MWVARSEALYGCTFILLYISKMPMLSSLLRSLFKLVYYSYRCCNLLTIVLQKSTSLSHVHTCATNPHHETFAPLQVMRTQA
jgi:hypothetical protein